MNSSQLETTDIFKSAFYLTMGCELAKIQFSNNGNQIATFQIKGKNIEKLDRDYMCGKARVNPVQLKHSLNWLRDSLFEVIRNTEGRYESDRTRKNRRYQKQR